jgi:hypothetical protein
VTVAPGDMAGGGRMNRRSPALEPGQRRAGGPACRLMRRGRSVAVGGQRSPPACRRPQGLAERQLHETAGRASEEPLGPPPIPRGMGDKAQKAHIRAIKNFAAFLKRSLDTATPEELRAYQLHMADAGITPTTFNARIVALRFFFGMTCGREQMKRYLQFSTQPRKLPVVFSTEEVSDLLMAAPGPGLK